MCTRTGVATFELGPSEEPAKLKTAFKSALNKIGENVTPEQRQKLIAEAQYVYKLNNRLVKQLRLRWWAIFLGWIAKFKLIWSVLLALFALYCGYAYIARHSYPTH